MSMEIVKIWAEVAKKAPDFAIKWGPILMDVTKDGIEVAKNVLEIINLNSANAGKEKKIKECYEKIGKLVYDKKMAVSDATVKDEIEKIDTYNKDIEKNKKKIAEIEQESKKSKIISDAKNIFDGIELGKKKTSRKTKKSTKKK